MSMLSIASLITKSVLSKPATRLYPFKKREPFANTRGHIEIDINTCIYCTLCARKCPTNAITVTKAKREWTIDQLKCIACGACVEACPKKCLTMANTYASCTVDKKIESHIGPAIEPKKTADDKPNE